MISGWRRRHFDRVRGWRRGFEAIAEYFL